MQENCLEDLVVLVAEDDPGHLRLITKQLKKIYRDIEVQTFSNGQELVDFLFPEDDAVNLDPKKKYALLLDIKMPKIDGIQVLQLIKKNPDLTDMPIIMISSSDDAIEILHCLNLGCTDYIIKPTELNAFPVVIKKAMETIFLTLNDGNIKITPEQVAMYHEKIKNELQD